MRPRRSTVPFLVLLAPVVFVGSAPAPAVSAAGAPRPTNDAGSRGKPTGALRPEAAQLVTGSPVHLQSVVAGTPPTAILAITPVAEKVAGSYPPGTTIVGNTLTAPSGGFRAFFDVTVKDWDPNGDGSPGLHALQVAVDPYGYLGSYADPANVGCDLAPPVIPCPGYCDKGRCVGGPRAGEACTRDADCNGVLCRDEFGESWAKCEYGYCKAGYVDKTGTSRPADNFCAPDSCDQADVDTTSYYYRWIAIHSLPNRPDGHIVYYLGSLVLDVPACAQGKYTVSLDNAQTFLADLDSVQIATLEENGFVVNIPDPEGNKPRGISFSAGSLPVATGAPGQAIRVTMVELHHPNPRNAVATVALPTQTVPQNFSTFDTNSNGVCSGAAAAPNYNGHPCGTDADCLCNTPSCAINDAAHNGVCIGNPAPPLVACTAESFPADASGQGGCARWVGKPATFLEDQQVPGKGKYRTSRLQCTPFYYDWVTETAGKVCAGPLAPQSRNGESCGGAGDLPCGPGETCVPKKITVVGAEILPSSTYSVQAYGASCQGSEGSCTNVSAPVTMLTHRHGDVAEPLIAPDAVGQPNGIDVSEIVNAFKKAGPLRKAGAKITPNLPEENLDIGADDIGSVVDAAKGFAYPPIASGPCPCPSTVTCGATPCTCDAGPACPACGGGQCVKVCSVGSVNEGLPCRDNDPVHKHCPGGTCGSGFCRDKCGRCTPP